MQSEDEKKTLFSYIIFKDKLISKMITFDEKEDERRWEGEKCKWRD